MVYDEAIAGTLCGGLRGEHWVHYDYSLALPPVAPPALRASCAPDTTSTTATPPPC